MSDAHVRHDSLDAAISHLRKRVRAGKTIILFYCDTGSIGRPSII
jgi:hypothetical protein